MQHYDKWDLWMIGTLSLFLALLTLRYIAKAVLNYHWKRMKRWPKEQHASYFSSSKR